MRIVFLTIFPEMFAGFREFPLVKRAIERGMLEVEVIDIKDYADGSFRHIDDSPYGGGAGMVMRYPVLDAALKANAKPESRKILLAASGSPFTQAKAHELAACADLVFVCGHYEGVDERITEDMDEELSIGDYVLSGGEPGAMVIADAIVRLCGTIREESTGEESYENGLLEYPQYTKPREYNGRRVPDVLLSGDHEKIRRWRRRKSLEKTARVRPDLLEAYPLSEEERKLLNESEKE